MDSIEITREPVPVPTTATEVIVSQDAANEKIDYKPPAMKRVAVPPVIRSEWQTIQASSRSIKKTRRLLAAKYRADDERMAKAWADVMQKREVGASE